MYLPPWWHTFYASVIKITHRLVAFSFFFLTDQNVKEKRKREKIWVSSRKSLLYYI
ncbi:Uncharacterized protein TCM_043682 [Theobroma cacao]|uniref:Uncharacterized protein n=1 Tax=Theobroma cacao TaxID=3641 RepID=A0A061FW41_THECC|nr:Uncharacterized protein TCM_043682 [Theobroma cacao]